MKSKQVRDAFRRAYKVCEESFDVSESESIKHDLHQRMDELCLVYSDIFNTSVNEAQKKLTHKEKCRLCGTLLDSGKYPIETPNFLFDFCVDCAMLAETEIEKLIIGNKK